MDFDVLVFVVQLCISYFYLEKVLLLVLTIFNWCHLVRKAQ